MKPYAARLVSLLLVTVVVVLAGCATFVPGSTPSATPSATIVLIATATPPRIPKAMTRVPAASPGIAAVEQPASNSSQPTTDYPDMVHATVIRSDARLLALPDGAEVSSLLQPGELVALLGTSDNAGIWYRAIRSGGTADGRVGWLAADDIHVPEAVTLPMIAVPPTCARYLGTINGLSDAWQHDGEEGLSFVVADLYRPAAVDQTSRRFGFADFPPSVLHITVNGRYSGDSRAMGGSAQFLLAGDIIPIQASLQGGDRIGATVDAMSNENLSLLLTIFALSDSCALSSVSAQAVASREPSVAIVDPGTRVIVTLQPSGPAPAASTAMTDSNTGQVGTPSGPTSQAPVPYVPKAATATPGAWRSETVTVTDTEASNLAQAQLNEAGLPTRDILVQFSPDDIVITGQTHVLLVWSPLRVIARPYVDNEEARVKVTAFAIGGVDMMNTSYPEKIERAINRALLRQLSGRRVQSVALQSGMLEVGSLVRP